MASNAFKRLKEDMENNTSTVLGSVTKVTSQATKATSAGYAGTSYLSTSAGQAGTAVKATSAGRAGTSFVAHYASSGTAALAGTSSIWSTGGL